MSRIYDAQSSIYQRLFNRFHSARTFRWNMTYSKKRQWMTTKKRAELVSAFGLEEGMKIFDVGCGTGEIFELMPEGTIYSGIDVSSKAIKTARTKHRYGFFCQADIVDANFLEDCFDVVLCIGVLPYIPSKYAEMVGKKLLSCLKKGGRLIVVERTGYSGTRLDEFELDFGRMTLCGDQMILERVK